MRGLELRSRLVTVKDEWQQVDDIEKTCNAGAADGFEVFSVLCPRPANYNTFRLTAVKRPSIDKAATGRRFR